MEWEWGKNLSLISLFLSKILRKNQRNHTFDQEKKQKERKHTVNQEKMQDSKENERRPRKKSKKPRTRPRKNKQVSFFSIPTSDPLAFTHYLKYLLKLQS